MSSTLKYVTNKEKNDLITRKATNFLIYSEQHEKDKEIKKRLTFCV
jgi:hypothetical protein